MELDGDFLWNNVSFISAVNKLMELCLDVCPRALLHDARGQTF